MNRTRRAFPGGFALATVVVLLVSTVVSLGGYVISQTSPTEKQSTAISRRLSEGEQPRQGAQALYSLRRPRLLRFELFLTPGPATEDRPVDVALFNHLV